MILTAMVLLIVLTYALGGYRKGFIKTLLSMVFLILAVVLVYFAGPYVNRFLKEQTPVYEVIEKRCQTVFNLENLARLQADGETEPTEPEMELTRIEQSKVIERLMLPELLKNQLIENNHASGYAKLAVTNFENYVAAFMANLVVTALAYVVTFLAAVLFLKIFGGLLGIITELPGVRGMNHILGFFLGAVQGVLAVWILFLILTMFGSTDPGQKLLRVISESPVLSWFYDGNLILRILMGMFGGTFF